jgi:hypothetical protein
MLKVDPVVSLFKLCWHKWSLDIKWEGGKGTREITSEGAKQHIKRA